MQCRRMATALLFHSVWLGLLLMKALRHARGSVMAPRLLELGLIHPFEDESIDPLIQ
ncbi:MAG: hypothetical protein K0Q50_2601 [Vampirovibrio sp.]|jgi:hypothetical protein|nr:hypothetical protein [Vampirovibrio sp.]